MKATLTAASETLIVLISKRLRGSNRRLTGDMNNENEIRARRHACGVSRLLSNSHMGTTVQPQLRLSSLHTSIFPYHPLYACDIPTDYSASMSW